MAVLFIILDLSPQFTTLSFNILFFIIAFSHSCPTQWIQHNNNMDFQFLLTLSFNILKSLSFDLSTFVTRTFLLINLYYRLYPTIWLHSTKHLKRPNLAIQKDGSLKPVRPPRALSDPIIYIFRRFIRPPGCEIIGLFCTTLCLPYDLILVFKGPTARTYQPRPPRWKLRQAFPRAWMILSCVMLPPSTAGMFQHCTSFGLMSTPDIHLDNANVIRDPRFLYHFAPFIPLPSKYKPFDSGPQRCALHKQNLAIAENFDTLVMLQQMQDLINQGHYDTQLYEDEWLSDALNEANWYTAVQNGSTIAQQFGKDIILDMSRLLDDNPFVHPTAMPCANDPPTVPPVKPPDFDLQLTSAKTIEQRLVERYGDLSNKTASQAYNVIMSHPNSSFILSARNDASNELVPVIMDTGCTFAVTFCLEDYPAGLQLGDFGKIKQVDGKQSAISGFGIGGFQVANNKGKIVTITMPMFYVPDCKQRLLSPQDYASFHGFPRTPDKDAYSGNGAFYHMKLQDNQGRFTCNIDCETNLPIAMMGPVPQVTKSAPHVPQPHASCLRPANKQSDAAVNGVCDSDSYCDATAALDILDESNENLTVAQKTLMLDHQRLGHLNMKHLQTLYKDHKITCDFDGCSSNNGTACLPARHQSVANCTAPLCFACRQAKAKKRTTLTKTVKDLQSRKHILSSGKLQPGDRVSLDQYQSSVRGRRYETAGKEHDKDRYCGGTIFYDHASGLIMVYHQATLSAADTLKSKRLFEMDCARSGVIIKSYHTDNGIFTSDHLQADLESKRQQDSFSGVGAKHQNGCAERSIQSTVNSARAMLIHAYTHWPDETDTDLWPFAMTYAAWLHNHIPGLDNHLAPIEIFTGTRVNCEYLRCA